MVKELVDGKRELGRVNMNDGASASSRSNNDWCLACNDPHYQDSCPIYQHQVYLSKNNGVSPYEHDGPDPASVGNFVNFNPADVSVLRVETRSAKRPLAPDIAKDDKRPFATCRRREEEEDHKVSGGEKDKMEERILRKEHPNAKLPPDSHLKGPTQVNDDMHVEEESREQVVRKLRFPSLMKIHRREQIDHFRQKFFVK